MIRKMGLVMGTTLLVMLLILPVFITACGPSTLAPSPAAPVPTATAKPAPAPTSAPTTTTTPAPTTKTTAPAKVIELKYADHDSLTGPGHTASVAWAKKVEDATQGRVKITVYGQATLSPPTQTYDAIVSGVADMGWGFIGFYPNRFPLSDMLSLPCLGVPNATVGSLAMWNNYKKFPEIQAEYKDVKVLLLHTHQGAPIGTKKTAIRTLDDMKGQKIRSPAGGALTFLKNAGASPLMIPPSDIYLSMQKGVIDGWTIDFIGAAGYNLGEVTAYYTTPYYYVGTFWVVMNKDTWNSLPKDIQGIIDGLSGDAGIRDTFAPSFDRGDEQAKARMGIKPEQVITVTPQEWQRWVGVAQGVWKEEVARQVARGMPAQAILDETLNFIKNNSK